mmetsp:Transcript_123515/g.394544  ORF Transcript_123515/g.394544 Transcript_123515/m.394544 type:complete len:203 (+) Transcript_123515:37-645(+)
MRCFEKDATQASKARRSTVLIQAPRASSAPLLVAAGCANGSGAAGVVGPAAGTLAGRSGSSGGHVSPRMSAKPHPKCWQSLCIPLGRLPGPCRGGCSGHAVTEVHPRVHAISRGARGRSLVDGEPSRRRDLHVGKPAECRPRYDSPVREQAALAAAPAAALAAAPADSAAAAAAASAHRDVAAARRPSRDLDSPAQEKGRSF